MGTTTYCILDGATIIAKGMELPTALIMLKGLMEEYFAEPDIEFILRRESEVDDGKEIHY